MRQPKTSKRVYDDRQKVKCGICGNDSQEVKLVKVKGILRWICSTCNGRLKIDVN